MVQFRYGVYASTQQVSISSASNPNVRASRWQLTATRARDPCASRGCYHSDPPPRRRVEVMPGAFAKLVQITLISRLSLWYKYILTTVILTIYYHGLKTNLQLVGHHLLLLSVLTYVRSKRHKYICKYIYIYINHSQTSVLVEVIDS